jgi:hypothetical protein
MDALDRLLLKLYELEARTRELLAEEKRTRREVYFISVVIASLVSLVTAGILFLILFAKLRS